MPRPTDSRVRDKRGDGPVVSRPSSRPVGMLIVSRADCYAIKRRAGGQAAASESRECARKGKGLGYVKLRVSRRRFP